MRSTDSQDIHYKQQHFTASQGSVRSPVKKKSPPWRLPRISEMVGVAGSQAAESELNWLSIYKTAVLNELYHTTSIGAQKALQICALGINIARVSRETEGSMPHELAEELNWCLLHWVSGRTPADQI